MMKMTSKFVLVAAVAALAIAGSVSDTLARGHMKPAACAPVWALKTNTCANGVCSTLRCQPDGKWYPSLVVCWQPWCPK